MSELSPNEQKYLEDFIIQSKQELKPEKEQRKAPDWEKLLTEIKHKGYLIEKNPYDNLNMSYQFTSTEDCDEPMGFGKDIIDCINQINEKNDE